MTASERTAREITSGYGTDPDHPECIVADRDELNANIAAALQAVEAERRIGPCEVCWFDAWEPVEHEAECALAHPHKTEREHVRCGHCWLREQYDALRARLRAVEGALEEADKRLSEASRMRAGGGFVGDNIDRWLTTVDMMTRPLIRAALTPGAGEKGRQDG